MWVYGRAAFSKSFDLKRCDTNVSLFFPTKFSTHPLIHETLSLVAFQFGIFRAFGFWTLLDCHLIVLRYGFGIAHRYASNVKLCSETQNYLFWCEFAKPRFFRMLFGFRHCKVTIQVLPIAVFGLAGFYYFSRPCVKMEGNSFTQIWNRTFFYVLPIHNVQLDASFRFRVWAFSIRRVRLIS